MASREHSLTNPVWKGREEELLPLCSGAESDSANLDHVAELLMRTGVPAEESLMILVPEAYDNHPDLQKHYPEVHGLLMRSSLIGVHRCLSLLRSGKSAHNDTQLFVRPHIVALCCC